jgi:RsiW-degrading membrane proteinase PrsW (M82 family)
LLLALAAAHFYAAPSFDGAARSNAWFELDFCLALASHLVAVGVGVYAGGMRGVRARAALSRALSWLLLTLVLGLAWASFVALLTLLIAPSHAFASLRVAALVRVWNAERKWQRRR